jgi:hypothetical protein
MPKTQLPRPPRDILNEGPEICVWMTAFGCLNEMHDILVLYRDGVIDKKAYFKRTNKMLVELADVADAATRFELVLPVCLTPNYKEELASLDDIFVDVTFHPVFWRWFNWWDDYIRAVRAESKEAAERIYLVAMERLPELETYRPSGTWLKYRSNPSILLIPLPGS